VDLHIEQKAIEEAYAELTSGLTDEDRDRLGKAAAKISILVKAPQRIRAICADIAKHYQEKVAPNGFGAQVDLREQRRAGIFTIQARSGCRGEVARPLCSPHAARGTSPLSVRFTRTIRANDDPVPKLFEAGRWR
jgi:hypothetical protein